MDDQRDYAEESYWRSYCPECDGPCTSPDGHADPVDLDQVEQLAADPPTCGPVENRGRTAMLRAAVQQRTAALRTLPPAGTLHA